MSAYVKSIDPYHMVSVGDEGFYNLGYQEAARQDLPSSAYSGYYGVDFDKLMTIETVDFGTPHMYVDQWGFDLGDDDLESINAMPRPHLPLTSLLSLRNSVLQTKQSVMPLIPIGWIL